MTAGSVLMFVISMFFVGGKISMPLPEPLVIATTGKETAYFIETINISPAVTFLFVVGLTLLVLGIGLYLADRLSARTASRD
jgi:hypothetical protein